MQHMAEPHALSHEISAFIYILIDDLTFVLNFIYKIHFKIIFLLGF